MTYNNVLTCYITSYFDTFIFSKMLKQNADYKFSMYNFLPIARPIPQKKNLTVSVTAGMPELTSLKGKGSHDLEYILSELHL